MATTNRENIYLSIFYSAELARMSREEKKGQNSLSK